MQTQIISPDALITIQVSAGFHKRLQDLLLWIVNQQDSKAIQEVNEKIIQDKELQEWELHYYSLLVLIHSIEEAAIEQQKTQMTNLPAVIDQENQ